MLTRTSYRKRNDKDGVSIALAAVALQDHLMRRLRMGETDQFQSGVRLVGSQVTHQSVRLRQTPKHGKKSVAGLPATPCPGHKSICDDQEYVLDRKPPPLTLAQKIGLVEVPPCLLTEVEWKGVKDRAQKRLDFQQPCVICKDELGVKEHVLLSCTHVFHKSCLQAFERFTGKKTCPMCRREQYQTRVVYDGKVFFKHKCATIIQAAWRGYIVRAMYKKLRLLVPPNDPRLRKKFYEEKLQSITDRMVQSFDNNIAGFFSEMDRELEASRNIFKHFDDAIRVITEDEWQEVIFKAAQRGFSECSICLVALEGNINNSTSTHIVDHTTHVKKDTPSCLSSTASVSVSCSVTPDRSQTLSQNRTLVTSSKSACVQRRVPSTNKAVNKNSYQSSSSATKQCGRIVNKSSRSLHESQHSAGTVFRGKCKHGDAQTKAEVQDLKFGDDVIKDVVKGSGVERFQKPVVVLSCSHAFHHTCLDALEEFAVAETKYMCPICRAFYQKKMLTSSELLKFEHCSEIGVQRL